MLNNDDDQLDCDWKNHVHNVHHHSEINYRHHNHYVLGCVIAIDVDKDAGVGGDYRANHTDQRHTRKLRRNIKI